MWCICLTIAITYSNTFLALHGLDFVSAGDSASGMSMAAGSLVSGDSSADGGEAFVSVVSESLMDFFESLPKSTIRGILNDDQLMDFIERHEDQVFSQQAITIPRSEYDILHAAMKKIVSASQLPRMESLITFNVPKPSGLIVSNDTTSSNSFLNHTTDSEFPRCIKRFDDRHRLLGAQFRHRPAVKTLVEVEHIFSHPMMKIYSRRQAGRSGMGRILQNPNMLRELRSRKNKLLNVLFLDMSLISLLETKIFCYDILSEETMRMRMGVAFGKSLDAVQLSAIPSYVTHISDFASQALNASSVVFELLEKNYTSDVIYLSGTEPSPCLFFNMLNSCRNEGVCVGFTGIGNCRCKKGFKGTFCTSAIDINASKSTSGLDRWFNFLYMLVGVALVSATFIIIGYSIKTCAVDERVEEPSQSLYDDPIVKEDVLGPYLLPRVAITTASPSPSFRRRSLGASFSTAKRKKKVVIAPFSTASIPSVASASDPKSVTSSVSGGNGNRLPAAKLVNARYDHLTVP